jgi:hypothetical protein
VTISEPNITNPGAKQNMNIDNLTLSLLDAVSAVLCFVLVWFMTKPYRYTGERPYIGLPLAFSFLGVSFVMGLTMLVESTAFVDVMRWFQLFTQSYAFAFLAVTYYFSKRGKESTRLWLEIAFVAIFSVALVSYIIISVAPMYDLPHFDTVNDYLTIFNIATLSYIAIHTLRSHMSRPDAKTMWIPLSYILLDFSQYSLLIWSLDGSHAAFVGAHFLRITGLLVFLILTYLTFYRSIEGYPKKEIE